MSKELEDCGKKLIDVHGGFPLSKPVQSRKGKPDNAPAE
jgi:hypothetical protein